MIISGQKKAADYFRQTFRTGNFPPAVLLYGPSGSGKSRLAEDFIREWLCTAPGDRPCGHCTACREASAIRHPDFLLFSAKDIGKALRAWIGLLPRVSPAVAAAGLLPYLYRIEQAFVRGFLKIDDAVSVRGNGGRSRTEKLDREALAAGIYDLEKALLAATDKDALADAAEELLRLSGFIHWDVLRIDGVREIIGILSRRPLLGGRRVVLVERADRLNTPAANAFLKTIEEAATDTMLILTAPSLKSVLPTIRSRCALVPVFKIKAAEMERIAAEGLGLPDAVSADGCPGFLEYLERLSGRTEGLKDLLIAFFDELEAGNGSDGIFALASSAAGDGLVPAFLEELESLFSQAILARRLGVGRDAVYVRLLENIDLASLERLQGEVMELLGRIPVFHLNQEQSLLSAFYGLYEARWGRT